MSQDATGTAGLREEHQWILKVSSVLEAILDREPEAGLDFDSLEDCVRFIRLFADACHHGQEEDLLFPELESLGMPRESGPIAVMLHEHQVGRTLVQHMVRHLPSAREGNQEARAVLVNAARGYVQLIRAHIHKEDNVLFNLADQVVTGAACSSLCERYETVCKGRFEGCSKEALQELARRLLGKYGAEA